MGIFQKATNAKAGHPNSTPVCFGRKYLGCSFRPLDSNTRLKLELKKLILKKKKISQTKKHPKNIFKKKRTSPGPRLRSIFLSLWIGYLFAHGTDMAVGQTYWVPQKPQFGKRKHRPIYRWSPSFFLDP